MGNKTSLKQYRPSFWELMSFQKHSISYTHLLFYQTDYRSNSHFILGWFRFIFVWEFFFALFIFRTAKCVLDEHACACHTTHTQRFLVILFYLAKYCHAAIAWSYFVSFFFLVHFSSYFLITEKKYSCMFPLSCNLCTHRRNHLQREKEREARKNDIKLSSAQHAHILLFFLTLISSM